MNNKLLLSLAMSLAFLSCDKEEIVLDEGMECNTEEIETIDIRINQLIGQWEWVGTNVWFPDEAAGYYTPASTGDYRRIEFKENNEYINILNEDTTVSTWNVIWDYDSSLYVVPGEGPNYRTFHRLSIIGQNVLDSTHYKIYDNEFDDSLSIYHHVTDGNDFDFVKL